MNSNFGAPGCISTIGSGSNASAPAPASGACYDPTMPNFNPYFGNNAAWTFPCSTATASGYGQPYWETGTGLAAANPTAPGPGSGTQNIQTGITLADVAACNSQAAAANGVCKLNPLYSSTPSASGQFTWSLGYEDKNQQWHQTKSGNYGVGACANPNYTPYASNCSVDPQMNAFSCTFGCQLGNQAVSNVNSLPGCGSGSMTAGAGGVNTYVTGNCGRK